jgi:hypothetical protein
MQATAHGGNSLDVPFIIGIIDERPDKNVMA